jgi:hypothetical protein
VQRTLSYADLLIGAALWNARQTGLDKQQAVQEKLSQLAVYREGISAHLTASIGRSCRRTRRKGGALSRVASAMTSFAGIATALATIAPEAKNVGPATRLMGSGAVVDSIGFASLLRFNLRMLRSVLLVVQI